MQQRPAHTSATRRAELDEVARAQLDPLRDAEGRLSLPVDPAALAQTAGLRVQVLADGIAGVVVRNVDGAPISGVLDFDTGRIWVNGRDAAARQRFTIAHELAHELLGHEAVLGGGRHVVPGVRAVGGDDPEVLQAVVELEADHLAGRLLVPPDELDRRIAELGGASVPLLAELFGVSPMAMQLHLRPYLPPAGRAG